MNNYPFFFFAVLMTATAFSSALMREAVPVAGTHGYGSCRTRWVLLRAWLANVALAAERR